MPRFWLCHWQFRYWNALHNQPGVPVIASGSNSFSKRGVSPGDYLYVVSISEGHLYLGGRMRVSRIGTRNEAVRALGHDGLWDAEEWALGSSREGTPLNLRRRLSNDVTRQILYIPSKGPVKPLAFKAPNRLDEQATRGLREIVPESAKLLDRVLAVGEGGPQNGALRTITSRDLNLTGHSVGDDRKGTSKRQEGAPQIVELTRYERDRANRVACLDHHGPVCKACGFDFLVAFGEIGYGCIHVHHLDPLSSATGARKVDPVKDMAPLCPNCHSVAHRRNPPFTIAELKKLRQRHAG